MVAVPARALCPLHLTTCDLLSLPWTLGTHKGGAGRVGHLSQVPVLEVFPILLSTPVVAVLVRRSGAKAGVWYCTSTDHGSPSRLQNHVWGQIDSAPAVMEFLGSITSSWRKESLGKRQAGKPESRRAIHSLKSSRLQISVPSEHVLRAPPLGAQRMEPCLGAEESPSRLPVGI